MATYYRYENQPDEIEWHGSENGRPNPVQTTLYTLSKEERDFIVIKFRTIDKITMHCCSLIPKHINTIDNMQGKYYKLAIIVTEVDDSDGWWFMSCKVCWKKGLPNGNAYRCTGKLPLQRREAQVSNCRYSYKPYK
jgi:hypothetical protein